MSLAQVSQAGGAAFPVRMYRVYGNITTEAIASRAVLAENPAGRFSVMHPLDVLQGRLKNVYGLSAKQDEHGMAQLRVAIDVVRKFVDDIASQESTGSGSARRPVTLRHLARIETLALSDAGRRWRRGAACTSLTRLTRYPWYTLSRL